MDQAKARALLAGERDRLQRLLQTETSRPPTTELGDEVDDADRRNAEETGLAVDQLLRARWAALQRAEARLAAGSYGQSVASGQAIADERLEAFPLAELTVDEEAKREQAERPFAEAVERAADGEDRAGRDPDRLDAARLGPSREPFQVLQDPAVQDNPLVEDDETTFDEPPPRRDPAMPPVPDGIAEDDTGRIQPLP
jgi:DnaK suppressor protein